MPEQLSFPFPPVRNICGTCGCFWRLTDKTGECLGHTPYHIAGALTWIVVRLYEDAFDCHSAGQPGRT